MKARSIRFRLTAWYAVALGIALAIFAFAIWFSMRRSFLKDLDDTLLARAHSTATFINSELAEPDINLNEELSEYSSAFPTGTDMAVFDAHRSIIFTSNAEFRLPAGKNLGAGFHRIYIGKSEYRLFVEPLAIPGHSWNVALATTLKPIWKTLSRLRTLLIGLIPVVIILASCGGNWLSRRALKPVDDITAAARSIGIANLSERLTVPQTGDELQRLSETWNSMLSRLEAAVKQLSRFTADASHELRTPLAIVHSTAEIALRKPRTAEDYRRALSEILAESRNMTHIIEDLLALARFDSESVDMPMTPVSLASIACDLCHEIQPLSESRHIKVRGPEWSEAFQVLGNELALRRLLLILLDNAIKYSEPGGSVAVSLTRDKGRICLGIRDSGPGIPPSELPRIFDRFYRAPQAREASRDGYGLGLALAASIAKRHHATIDVDSLPGRGSTFSVQFYSLDTHSHSEPRPKEAVC